MILINSEKTKNQKMPNPLILQGFSVLLKNSIYQLNTSFGILNTSFGILKETSNYEFWNTKKFITCFSCVTRILFIPLRRKLKYE